MCRRRDQLDSFTRRGIDAVLGNFEDPASLRRAMTGCKQLVQISPPALDQLSR